MKNFIFMIILLFISSSCYSQEYKTYLHQEIDEIFPDRPNKAYFNIEDKKYLSSIDNSVYLFQEMYQLAKRKIFRKEWGQDTISYTQIIVIMLDHKLIDQSLENRTLIIKIFTLLNKNLSPFDLSNSGMYKIYDRFVKKIFKNVDSALIVQYINSIPDLRVYILANLNDLLEFNYKVNYKEFYYVYKNINKDNYKKLLKGNKDIFPINSSETIDRYIDELSYYYKLKDFAATLYDKQ